jgi:hypothetical protein
MPSTSIVTDSNRDDIAVVPSPQLGVRSPILAFEPRDDQSQMTPPGSRSAHRARHGAQFLFRLLGIGAMASPRFAPAGALMEHASLRVLFDGGPGAEASDAIDAWLVTDEDNELMAAIRRAAEAVGVRPAMAGLRGPGWRIDALEVEHTVRRTVGYRIDAGGTTTVWAPEFSAFPAWAGGADLMFAEAASWARPIRFRGGVGGHMAVLDVAVAAREAGVRRLVFAHLGRPTLRALDQGAQPPYGEIGVEGRVYVPRRRHPAPVTATRTGELNSEYSCTHE